MSLHKLSDAEYSIFSSIEEMGMFDIGCVIELSKSIAHLNGHVECVTFLFDEIHRLTSKDYSDVNDFMFDIKVVA